MLLENELYKSLYHTLILFIMGALLSTVAYVILSKMFNISTEKSKLKMRVVYISSILMFFFLAKIWLQGFTQIFYGLSLVSAGLVVSNKESIMNLVGWGIISWRGLFSEGDYVEVSGASGIVYELGVLYFKLLESTPSAPHRSTGKFIKVPNGAVINNPVKRIALDRHFIEQKIQCLLPISADIKAITNEVNFLLDTELSKKNSATMPHRRAKKDIDLVKSHVHQQNHVVEVLFVSDKVDHLLLNIQYHCLAKGSNDINAKLKQLLLIHLKSPLVATSGVQEINN